MLNGYDIEALRAFQRSASSDDASASGAARARRAAHGPAGLADAHARIAAAWLGCVVGSTFLPARLVWPKLFR